MRIFLKQFVRVIASFILLVKADSKQSQCVRALIEYQGKYELVLENAIFKIHPSAKIKKQWAI